MATEDRAQVHNGSGTETQHTADLAELPDFPDFRFRGNALALDFIATERKVRGRRVDLLPTPAALTHWWRAAREQHPEADYCALVGDAQPLDERILAEAKQLRGALRVLFEAEAEARPLDASALERLNQVLRTGYQQVRQGAGGRATAVYESRSEPGGHVLLPIALSALRLLTAEERGRLRKCQNDLCMGVFYDTSKSATRRWCGEDCMNRARSRQHYAQIKRQAAHRQ